MPFATPSSAHTVTHYPRTGDVADTLPATRAALGLLKERFGRVFYVPGGCQPGGLCAPVTAPVWDGVGWKLHECADLGIVAQSLWRLHASQAARNNLVYGATAVRVALERFLFLARCTDGKCCGAEDRCVPPGWLCSAPQATTACGCALGWRTALAARPTRGPSCGRCRGCVTSWGWRWRGRTCGRGRRRAGSGLVEGQELMGLQEQVQQQGEEQEEVEGPGQRGQGAAVKARVEAGAAGCACAWCRCWAGTTAASTWRTPGERTRIASHAKSRQVGGPMIAGCRIRGRGATGRVKWAGAAGSTSRSLGRWFSDACSLAATREP